jgi:hypothetical protein
MVTVEDVRPVAMAMPGTYERLVRDRVKFRVGRYVYLAFSRDETTMGFGYLKEEREALVASDPDTFFMPGKADLRYHWVCAWLAKLEPAQMRELVVDAWAIAAPKRLLAAYRADHPDHPDHPGR